MQGALVDATRDAVASSGGRAIPAEKLHVTVAFIGAVASSRVAILAAITQRVTASADPFTIAFDRVERWSRQRLLCATASDTPDASIRMVDHLKRELAASGFAVDHRPFRAHVTLVRRVERDPGDRAIESLPWPFAALTLVESELSPKGSTYRVVDAWRLGTRPHA